MKELREKNRTSVRYTSKVLSLARVEGIVITAQDSGEALSGVQGSSIPREGGSS